MAAGERLRTMHEYRELFELHAADIIQPDIAHFGGILNTKKLAAWADIYLRADRRTTSAARRHGGSAAPGGLHAEFQDQELQRF